MRHSRALTSTCCYTSDIANETQSCLVHEYAKELNLIRRRLGVLDSRQEVRHTDGAIAGERVRESRCLAMLSHKLCKPGLRPPQSPLVSLISPHGRPHPCLLENGVRKSVDHSALAEQSYATCWIIRRHRCECRASAAGKSNWRYSIDEPGVAYAIEAGTHKWSGATECRAQCNRTRPPGGEDQIALSIQSGE